MTLLDFFQMTFHIDMRDTEYVNVFLHNTRQVFPGWNRIYGTGVIYLHHRNEQVLVLCIELGALQNE